MRKIKKHIHANRMLNERIFISSFIYTHTHTHTYIQNIVFSISHTAQGRLSITWLSLLLYGPSHILWHKYCSNEAQPWHTSKEKERKSLADYGIVLHFTNMGKRPNLTVDMFTSLVCSFDLSEALTHIHHNFHISP